MASMAHEDKAKVQLITSCPYCGSRRWKINTTYSTIISIHEPENAIGDRAQSLEEIRCAGCNKKAILAAAIGVRDTETYQRARAREERINKNR